MEKVFKILIVFALLMLVIVYSVRVKDKKYREYYFLRRGYEPLQGGEGALVAVLDRQAPRAAKDMEQQLFFLPGERSVQVIDDLTGRPVVTIRLEQDPHGLIFDGRTGLLYCSSMEGAIMIVRKGESGLYKVLQTLAIPAGAEVVALDPTTGELRVQKENEISVYTNDSK